MSKEDSPHDHVTPRKTLPDTGGQTGIYLYEPAGIREQSGHIPTWLKIVAFGLIVWGINYAIRYWNTY